MTQAIATAKDGSKSNIQLKVYKPLKGQLQLLGINPLQSDEKVGLSTIFHTMLGQKGIDRPVDDEVRKVCDSVIEDVEKTLKTELKSLVPISYQKQTVAGLNYFIKVCSYSSLSPSSSDTFSYQRAYDKAYEQSFILNS